MLETMKKSDHLMLKWDAMEIDAARRKGKFSSLKKMTAKKS